MASSATSATKNRRTATRRMATSRTTMVVALAAMSMLVLSACLPAGPKATYWHSGVSKVGETVQVHRLASLRAFTGKAPLAPHGQLTDKARKWSTFMANGGCGTKKLCHSSLPQGITVSWKGLAENVGYGSTVNGVFDQFVHSAPHLKNFLGNWNYYGVGVVVKNGYYYVTWVFMRV